MADVNGHTALHFAAKEGDMYILHLLLEAGANKDAVNNFGLTPLCTAAANQRMDVACLLLEAGADKEKAIRYLVSIWDCGLISLIG